MARRIDAHQHYWRIEQDWHAWPNADLPAIHRDFLPADLLPDLDHAGVASTILVQSQPDDRDTDWMLALADRTPQVAAVVGWVDLRDAAAPDRIRALARHPRLRGLRPMLQDLPPDWILDPACAPALATMAQEGLVFDALIRPHHIAAIATLAERHPTLPIVVDHAAKPDLAGGQTAAWAMAMAALAQRPHVACKISGLVTEAAPDWQPQDLRPTIDHLLACFGPGRLLWGSDWPVLLLAASYADWADCCAGLLDHLDEADRALIFGGTARRLYRID